MVIERLVILKKNQNSSFQENVTASSLTVWRNVPTLQTAHGNILIFCQMVLLPNINFMM